jgi:hypothetical protein
MRQAKLHGMSYRRAVKAALLVAPASLVLAPALNGAAAGTAAPPANPLEVPEKTGCLPSGDGFLRARIRGSLNLDIDLRNAELECDGGARPDGSGIRLSFAGPVRSDGRRLRMVFGVARTAEGAAGSGLPTNLTVIFEGETRLFATRGDDKCTVDKLEQERVGSVGGTVRSYRVVASGFCIEPANTLNEKERIVVSSFDFAGRVTYTPAPATPPKSTSAPKP